MRGPQGGPPPGSSALLPRSGPTTSGGDGGRVTRAAVEQQSRRLRSGTTLPIGGKGASGGNSFPHSQNVSVAFVRKVSQPARNKRLR